MRKSFKIIIGIAIGYFFVGAIYGMTGEMRLAKKYGGSPWEAFLDPYA